MIGQPITLIWAAGEHEFRFAIGELRALEQACDAGVTVVLNRLLTQTFKVDDIYQVLRIGLRGGGMNEIEAIKLIEKSFTSANLFELSVTAANVLIQFVSWPTGKGEDAPEDDKPGEPTAAPIANPSEMARPDGQTSSGPLQ